MKLKRYMELRKLTMREAAQEIGCSHQRVHQLLSGETPGTQLAKKIFDWSEGAITLEELLYPENDAA